MRASSARQLVGPHWLLVPPDAPARAVAVMEMATLSPPGVLTKHMAGLGNWGDLKHMNGLVD